MLVKKELNILMGVSLLTDIPIEPPRNARGMNRTKRSQPFHQNAYTRQIIIPSPRIVCKVIIIIEELVSGRKCMRTI